MSDEEVKDFDPDAVDVGDGLPFIPISRQEELIIRSYLDDGKRPSEIAEKRGINIEVVNSVIQRAQLKRKADNIKEDIKEVMFKDKVPVMEAIGDLGLVGLLEWMESYVGTGKHKKMSVDDAQRFTNVIEKLHGMYRLQLGKSTQNIAVAIEHSNKTMEQLLEDLKKPSEEGGDPFVEYPEIPAIEDKSSEVVEVKVSEKEKVEVKAE